MVNIKELLKIKEAIPISTKKLPKHIAINIEENGQKQLQNSQLKKYSLIKTMTTVAFRLKIPVVTFLLLPERVKDSSRFSAMMDELSQFFAELSSWEYIGKNQVKVSVLGKWYDLPGRVVEPIKKVLEETKDYDNFFLNLCVSYDGQEELVGACQIIARLVKADKLDPISIDKQTIKENIYSSYFIPPDLVIRIGEKKTTGGILLWDSLNSVVYFSDKPWTEFTRTDLLRAILFYQKEAF